MLPWKVPTLYVPLEFTRVWVGFKCPGASFCCYDGLLLIDIASWASSATKMLLVLFVDNIDGNASVSGWLS